MSAIYLDAQFVRAEIGRLIADYPEMADDETLRADVIEGETRAHRIIELAMEQRAEALTFAEAIKLREGDMQQRRSRFERKAEAMKSLIGGIMRAAGLEKLQLPEVTLFFTKPRQKVEIHSVEELPQGFYSLTRKPETAAIKSALEKGEEIPGAALVTGDAGLTIRTK